MFGAVTGDIAGSVYEWHNIKTKDFPLFSDDCFFTDDTVMTVAAADALMTGGEQTISLTSTKSGATLPGCRVRWSVRQLDTL